MAKRMIIALALMFAMLASFSVALAEHRGPDSIITANVVEAIAKAMPPEPRGMDPYTIDVYTLDGVVTLRGKMKGLDHVKLAEEVAKKVPGVKAVKNNISIKQDK